jgi:amino acid transporter
VAGVAYILPITGAIVGLLAILCFSYRQTIAAYPGGGGSYTVARENLGDGAGLLAAAALMIDYVLTAVVGISAGVGALVSAIPGLQPHTLALCLSILLIVTVGNLRGVREAGRRLHDPDLSVRGLSVHHDWRRRGKRHWRPEGTRLLWSRCLRRRRPVPWSVSGCCSKFSPVGARP